MLNSAIANAENNFNLDRDNLYVKEAYANDGPQLKRWRPRAEEWLIQYLKELAILEW